MNDDIQPGFGSEETEAEREALKNKADALGIDYHPKIGDDKLKERIANHLAETPEISIPAPPVPKKETKQQHTQRKISDAGALKRVRISCMNPLKSEWEGEIFTCGNRVVGNFKKFVPFETEWHVPSIILGMIEDRKYQSFFTVRDPRTGQQGRKGKLVKEFAVEYLPDLTKDELKDLARRQAMAAGTAQE